MARYMYVFLKQLDNTSTCNCSEMYKLISYPHSIRLNNEM